MRTILAFTIVVETWVTVPVSILHLKKVTVADARIMFFFHMIAENEKRKRLYIFYRLGASLRNFYGLVVPAGPRKRSFVSRSMYLKVPKSQLFQRELCFICNSVTRKATD